MRRFGLKTDVDFANFSLDSDMVFEGITVVTINVFIASIPNEQGRKRKMRIRSGFEELSGTPPPRISRSTPGEGGGVK